MDFTSMDPLTAKVAIQLQLADIADLLDSLYSDDPTPQGDERASLETIQRDLTQQLSLLEGQVLVIKILKNEYSERVAFKKLLEEERQAVSDHQLAMRLAGIATGAANAAFDVDYEAQLREAKDTDQNEQWEMAKNLYAAAFEETPSQPTFADRAPLHGVRTAPAGQPSIGGTESKILDSHALVKCVSCMEIVSTRKTLRLQCNPEPHTYCRSCLLDLFTSAITNTTLFPPRCCKVVIPLDTCRAMLPKELIKDFGLKVEELATPNPTYCANAGCSKFIQPKSIKDDVGICAFCKQTTCTQCKNQEHNGLCPSDPHVQLLMDAAKRSKWQQCTKCKNMVELAQGCFHMTCRCRHQFCYLCGVQWKKCNCPAWDEEYLTRPTPVAPVFQHAPAPVAPPVPHIHNWVRHTGGACQACGVDWLPFVMRCVGCDFASSWRCIHNRD